MAKKLAVLTGLVLVVGLLVFNGGQTATADLSAGLVGYWKFDEGSGSLALDSASGNTGTINGGAVYTSTGIAPVLGNVSALTFDGVDDFVAVPHATVPDVTTAYTISVWLNMTFVSGYQPILIRGNSTANDLELYWYPDSFPQGLTVAHNRGNGGPFNFVYFSGAPTNRLFHLAIVFDGNAIVRAYYDGVPAAVRKLNTTTPTTMAAPLATNKGWRIGKVDHPDFRIGATSFPGFFEGLMDEVRIYNRALSASEITALANPASSDCEADLTQCESAGAQCNANLTLCTNNLGQATAALGQCQSDRAQGNANLALCTNSLGQANAALGQCHTTLAATQATLAATQAALAAATADADHDGVLDRYDHCPGTAPGAAVDCQGCSLAQFCAAIDATTLRGMAICVRSDWKNDQPLLAIPGDCVVQRGNHTPAAARCVPCPSGPGGCVPSGETQSSR